MRVTRLMLSLLMVAVLNPISAQAAPSCLGKRATIVGTNGSDFIRPVSGAVISALGGSDRIMGRANNVTICGGGGSDVIEIAGRDILASGGRGGDRIVLESPQGDERSNIGMGGPGRDLLIGGKGGEILLGNGGADEIRGLGGDDAIKGGGGGDNLKGGRGADLILGSAGADVLRGSKGHDHLEGKSGDDILRGGRGNDLLVPGEGADAVYGNGGWDLVSYAVSKVGVEVDLQRGRAFGTADDRLFGLEGVEGSSKPDVISGTSGPDGLLGNRGNDTLLGREGDDFLSGDKGDDRLDGGPGEDLAYFRDSETRVIVDLEARTAEGEGSDVVVDIEHVDGSEFNDVLTGDSADNQLFGYGGYDHIEGGHGGDLLDGGDNNDTLDGGPGDDLLDGGPGFDFLDGGIGINTCINGEDVVNCDSAPTPTASPSPQPDGDLPTLSSSVAYQADPSHSGVLEGVGVEPPLTEVWSRNLGGPVSYPVVGSGMVFVTIGGVATYGVSPAHLQALNSDSGETVWTFKPKTSNSDVYAAYQDGTVFVQTIEGVLSALEAETGLVRWSADLPHGTRFTSPPVVHGETIYATADEHILYAVDASTGELQWTRRAKNGGRGSIALSSASVFVSSGCYGPSAFDRFSSALRWSKPDRCTGGIGLTPVYDAGRLYARTSEGQLIFDTADGSVAGSLPSRHHPVADEGSLYLIRDKTLEARSPSGEVRWTFSSHNGTSADVEAGPFLVDSHVYVAGSHGRIYVLRASDGAVVDYNENYIQPAAREHQTPISGFGAGEGMIFVPAGEGIRAYRGS